MVVEAELIGGPAHGKLTAVHVGLAGPPNVIYGDQLPDIDWRTAPADEEQVPVRRLAYRRDQNFTGRPLRYHYQGAA